MNHTATAPTRHLPDGGSITPAGPYEVHVRDLSAGLPLFRVEVLHADSNHLHGDDHRSFATRAQAEHYRDALVGCLNDEHEGISDERLAEVADGINADLDVAVNERRAAAMSLNDDITNIMAGSRGFRGDRKTLAETVPAPVGRPVRNTKTGVFRKPLNEVQKNLISQARNNEIRVGRGVQPATLRAIHDKVGGRLNYRPGMGARKVIASLTLNAEVTA